MELVVERELAWLSISGASTGRRPSARSRGFVSLGGVALELVTSPCLKQIQALTLALPGFTSIDHLNGHHTLAECSEGQGRLEQAQHPHSQRLLPSEEEDVGQ